MKNKWKVMSENGCIAAVFIVVYLMALLLADVGYTFAAAVLLVCMAGSLYCWTVRLRRCPADLSGLLLLSWTFGLGLSILRLSSLHIPWTSETKICFGAFPVCYLLGDGIGGMYTPGKAKTRPFQSSRLLGCILAVAGISALTFVVEAVYLGYIPIFSKDTHAYNYFHVTGLHYFTVSCMMTPALSTIYLLDCKKNEKNLAGKQRLLLVTANLVSLAIAVMCISKLQFLLIVGLPVLIILGSMHVEDFRTLPWKKILLAAAGLILLLAGVVVVFTLFRHYEPGYLNDIFEFRNPNTPVWVQYPYMYIANNYANFNCMTLQLTEHTHGLKQLFPLFALTGTKFIWPQLVNFPLFVVKEEINTLTIIYDAYYDFGIPGVFGFGVLLGMANRCLARKCTHTDNPVWLLFYAQAAIYMVLSFFSAWYSVATTWFWFAITAVICLVVTKPSPNTVKG